MSAASRQPTSTWPCVGSMSGAPTSSDKLRFVYTKGVVFRVFHADPSSLQELVFIAVGTVATPCTGRD